MRIEAVIDSVGILVILALLSLPLVLVPGLLSPTSEAAQVEVRTVIVSGAHDDAR